MKETKTIAKAANFTAVDFGKMSEIKDYTLQLGPEIKIPGKVFGGQNVNATGGEFSFQIFAPGTETGFLHTHKNHEELYGSSDKVRGIPTQISTIHDRKRTVCP